MDNWVFEGQEGYDIAATAQRAFEMAFSTVSLTVMIITYHPCINWWLCSECPGE